MDKKKSSLFVGRWQLFHQGHKALMETVLKEGKPVVVAIRDMEIDHSNPFSTFERWSMIQKELSEYGSLVKIIIIPDIDEICYGRDVGYGIRKIDLEQQIENISGTKTRKELNITKRAAIPPKEYNPITHPFLCSSGIKAAVKITTTMITAKATPNLGNTSAKKLCTYPILKESKATTKDITI